MDSHSEIIRDLAKRLYEEQPESSVGPWEGPMDRVLRGGWLMRAAEELLLMNCGYGHRSNPNL